MPILLSGDAKTAYRDPCCYYLEGVYHLFMTVSVKEDGYMYNHVGYTASRVPDAFPPPRLLTEHDRTKNFSSPGSVLRVGDRYLLCICSYPLRLPFKKDGVADGSARLYCIETSDFEHFTEPRRLYPKGPATSDEGRMIDPFWMRDATDAGRYLLFYKQNGVSLSESRDLVSWTWLGRVDGGENASVLFEDGRYLLVHSPQNGIGLKVSHDLRTWTDEGVCLPREASEEWASGRLTAAYAMRNPTPRGRGDRYLVYFHGSRKTAEPETHGEASLALYYSDDLKSFRF